MAVTNTPKVVLVTGASTFLGCFLVARLAQNPTIDRIIAVDARVPSKDMLRRMGRAEFHRVDLRRPTIVKTVADARVDTVVHAATSVMDLSPHSAAIKEFNLIGAMQIFGACQRVETVRRVVLRSSSMIYGAGPKHPARLTEQTRTKHEPAQGYGRDLLDVEGYARGLMRRRPDVCMTILRTNAILGPQVPTRMGQYLRGAISPTVIGHEPRLQFLHEEDALAALEHATIAGIPGTFNIAGDGVLTLTQVLRRLGQVGLPVPPQILGAVIGALRGARMTTLRSDQGDYLTYGRVLDNTRMRTVLSFEPRFDSRQTVDDFAERGGLSPFIPPSTWIELERWVAQRALGTPVKVVAPGLPTVG